LPALLRLVSLPVLLLCREDDGIEKGASKSSSLAHAILILERFSSVTAVVGFALETFFLDDDDVDDVLLRRVTGLTDISSSGHLGLGAAPIIL
jgi:hypothetical protein